MKEKKVSVFGLGILALLAIFIPLAAPSIALANHNAINSNVMVPTILAGPLTLCVGGSSLNNNGTTFPVCSNLCDLVAQIANVIYYAIAFVIWIIAPILIAVGGVMIMLGGTNPEMIGRGRKTITGAIYGIIIVLVAWLIVFTFVNAFGGLNKYVGGFGGSNGKAACSTN